LSGLADAAVIDVHAHAVLAETMGAAGRFGPEIGARDDGLPWFRVGDYRLDGVRYVGSPFMDPDLRIRRMGEAGIDFQVLSPNPLTYFHFIEAPEAIRFCRTHNDVLARVVGARGDRLAGFAALPMQDVGAAVEELDRAVTDLGMLGGYIGTDLPRPLDDSAHDRLYEACVKLDVPLFIHPGPAGIDGPPGDARLKRFDLDVVIGFAAQESIAVATLIFGGVLDRHPALDVCLSHGGGSSAYLLGRLARAAHKRPWVPGELRPEGAFEERYRRLWFDTHLIGRRSEEFFIATVGRDRLVYGTNFVGWDAPEAGIEHKPEPDLADNARRLLRVNRRCGH
jgi:aminocarboxymuconate-semialdehyde decarboxylase